MNEVYIENIVGQIMLLVGFTYTKLADDPLIVELYDKIQIIYKTNKQSLIQLVCPTIWSYRSHIASDTITTQHLYAELAKYKDTSSEKYISCLLQAWTQLTEDDQQHIKKALRVIIKNYALLMLTS
jgi:hypothetical protein